MARAHSIWIVRKCDNRLIIGAWTVKHEMVTWLNQQVNDHLSVNQIAHVWEAVRIRDGKPASIKIIPLGDIL
jgi:hypothetical protein